MNNLEQSQIFFLISSVGFIVLWSLMAIFLFYLIKAMHTVSRIADKIEKDVHNISNSTKEMVEDMRDSAVFRFLFGKNKRHSKD